MGKMRKQGEPPTVRIKFEMARIPRVDATPWISTIHCVNGVGRLSSMIAINLLIDSEEKDYIWGYPIDGLSYLSKKTILAIAELHHNNQKRPDYDMFLHELILSIPQAKPLLAHIKKFPKDKIRELIGKTERAYGVVSF